MNKTIKKLLKIVGGILAVVVILLGAALVVLNNKSFQQKVLEMAVEELQKKLETRVEIDSISINMFNLDVNLYGIMIEDREKREMLKVQKIAADIELLKLLQNKIVIEKAELIGAEALLLKPSKEEPANYQFVIEAFKKPKDKDKEKKKEKKEKPKGKLELDVSDLLLKDIHVKHNELDIHLQQAKYHNGWISGQTAEIESVTLVCDTTFREGLKPFSASLGRLTVKGDFEKQIAKLDIYNAEYHWQSLWKKRNIMVDNLASVGHLTVNTDKGRFSATAKQAHYKNDNHLPRKNTGKPKRGFFDAKHLDVIADFHVVLDSISKNGITGHLNEFTAKDSITGIDVRKLQAKFKYVKDKIDLRDIIVQQKSTVLNITSGAIVLPSKKEGREFSYSTGVITGTAYLKDISRMFAPVLKNFTMPLNLSLTMKGTNNSLSFRNVKVSTNDKKLQLAATGGITDLKDKYKLHVRFDVSNMTAKTGIAEKIINQFATKKLMMNQLHSLGDINYTGSFDVLYKKEIFRGLLKTAAGNLNFEFALDELNKYVNGNVSSKKIELGKVMNIKEMGPMDASADFTVDISKPRTAKMRKAKGGKLPIGFFNAKVNDVSYLGIHIRNLTATLNSDGAVATGEVYQSGRIRDLYFSFSFTDTDQMQKMKVTKSGLKFHKETEEYKAQRAERKQQKKLEKEAKKEQKKQEKEAKKALKEQEKQAKKAQKEKEKQQKELEKQQKGDTQDGEKKGFFKKLFGKKKKTETT
jgi:hypothetical protein